MSSVCGRCVAPRQCRLGMKIRTATGPCGWSVACSRALPDFTLGQMVALTQVIEQTGRWPTVMQQTRLTLIPKDGGSAVADVGDLRPIAVESVWCRAWSAMRLRDCQQWMEAWWPADFPVRGPSSGASMVSLRVAMRMEAARLSKQPCVGWSADVRKCFDSIPPASPRAV